MKKKIRTFRNSSFYPVFFMIVISLIFVGILAAFYNGTKTRVKEYHRKKMQYQVLSIFNYMVDDLSKEYSEHIREVDKNTIFYYAAYDQDSLRGYCFPISGSGLWGSIHALLAVTPDFSKIINLEIIEQKETPGLGARITEEWFKKQFQNKDLVVQNKLLKYVPISQNMLPVDGDHSSIMQITGATATSQAVVTMIYREMQNILFQWSGE